MPLTPLENSYGLDNPEVRLSFELLATEIRVLLGQRLEASPQLKPVDFQGLVDRVVKNSPIFGSGKLDKPWRLKNFFYKRENLASISSDGIYEQFKAFYVDSERRSVKNSLDRQQESSDRHARYQYSILNGSTSSDIDNLAKDAEKIFLERAPNRIKAIEFLFELKNQDLSESHQELSSDILDMVWPEEHPISLGDYNGSDGFFKFLANTPFISKHDIHLFASELELNFISLFHSQPDFIELLRKTFLINQKLSNDKINDSFLGICENRLLIEGCLDLLVFNSEKEKRIYFYNYLFVYFSLEEKDVPISLLDDFLSNPSGNISEIVLGDKELVNRGILNVIAEAVGHYKVSLDFYNKVSKRILDLVIARLVKMPDDRLRKIVYREARVEIDQIAKGHSEDVKRFRKIALTSPIMKGFTDVIGDPSPYAYTDEQILDEYKLEERQKAERRGIYLPTWFDFAQFGMISRKRRADAEDKREASDNFLALEHECSKALIHYHGAEAKRQFKPSNVHLFSEGGSQAFERLSIYIKAKDSVLVTDQVYSGITSSIENRGVPIK